MRPFVQKIHNELGSPKRIWINFEDFYDLLYDHKEIGIDLHPFVDKKNLSKKRFASWKGSLIMIDILNKILPKKIPRGSYKLMPLEADDPSGLT